MTIVNDSARPLNPPDYRQLLRGNWAVWPLYRIGARSVTVQRGRATWTPTSGRSSVVDGMTAPLRLKVDRATQAHCPGSPRPLAWDPSSRMYRCGAPDLEVLVPFLESAAFAAVLTQATAWVQRASKEAADDEARLAAQLLFSAGVAVAALRTLDNAFRRVVSAVSQFDVSWADDRRQAVVDSILAIADSDVVLPELQDAVGYLHNEVPRLAEPEGAYARQILGAAEDIVDYLAKSPDQTPFQTKEQLTTLLSGIKAANTQQWVDRTIELCEEALWVFDRRGLGEATVRLGQLKAALVRKHPSIAPAPRWTLAAAAAPLTAE